MNLWGIFDLSRERIKRTLLLGTRWGEPGAVLPASPGEPFFIRNMLDPVNPQLTTALAPSAPDTPPGTPAAPVAQTSAVGGPVAAAPPAPPPPPLPESPWPPSQMDVGG